MRAAVARAAVAFAFMALSAPAVAQTDTFSINIPQCQPGHGYSCPTGTQGQIGNPYCPPPMTMGFLPKNWSCPTRGGWPDYPGYRQAITAIYILQNCNLMVRKIRTVPRNTPSVQGLQNQCGGDLPPLDGLPSGIYRTFDACRQSLQAALDQIVTVNKGTEPSTGPNRMPIAEVNQRLAQAKQASERLGVCVAETIKQIDGYQKQQKGETQTAQRPPLQGRVEKNDCPCADETVSGKLLPPGRAPHGNHVATDVHGRILPPVGPSAGPGSGQRPLQGRVEENVLKGGIEENVLPDPKLVEGALGFLEGFMQGWRECVEEDLKNLPKDAIAEILEKRLVGKAGRYAGNIYLIFETVAMGEALESAFDRLSKYHSTGGSMDYEDGRLSGALYCGGLDLKKALERPEDRQFAPYDIND